MTYFTFYHTVIVLSSLSNETYSRVFLYKEWFNWFLSIFLIIIGVVYIATHLVEQHIQIYSCQKLKGFYWFLSTLTIWSTLLTISWMTGAAFDTVIIACSVLLEPKLPISSFNTRTWFSFWKSDALFWKAHILFFGWHIWSLIHCLIF